MGELIVVGDRVLIEPDDGEQITDSGLFLPPSVAERERVGVGRVKIVGPGHLVQNPEYAEGDSWDTSKENFRFLPLQAQVGDHAFYLRNEAIELIYQGTKYQILPHSAILALMRPDPSDILTELFSNPKLPE